MLTYRSKQDATKKDLQHAAALLIAAAGVKLPGPMNVTAQSTNVTLQQSDPEYTSGVQFTGTSNVDALRELARAYEAGNASCLPLQMIMQCISLLTVLPPTLACKIFCI